MVDVFHFLLLSALVDWSQRFYEKKITRDDEYLDDFRGPDKNFRRKTLNYQEHPDNISVLTAPDSVTIHKGERGMEETKEFGDSNVAGENDMNLEGKSGNLRKRRIIHGVNTDDIAGKYHELIPLID